MHVRPDVSRPPVCRRGPERAVLFFAEDRPRRRARLAARMQLEGAADEAAQSLRRHRPEAAALAPRHDAVAPRHLRSGHFEEPLARRIPAENLLSRQHPQIPGLVAGESPEDARRQTVRRRVGHETVGRVSRDAPALRAQPQVAPPIRVQRREAVGEDARSAGLVEDREPHAIEAREAVQRGDPEEAVAGLVNARDDVLRQPGVCRPRFEPVLRPGRRGLAEDRQQRDRHQEHGCVGSAGCPAPSRLLIGDRSGTGL